MRMPVGLWSMVRAGLLALPISAAWAQQQPAGSGWTVHPEWVRAHEEFLASDVLHGRGSATRDEEIAATYVASRFIAYGLKAAPGMSGYLQSAQIVAPVLDGKATLRAGDLAVAEGQGMQLFSSTGAPVSGPLRKLTLAELGKHPDLEGAVVLVSDTSGLRTLARRGAVALLLEESETAAKIAGQFGGKTQVAMRLRGTPAQGLTLLVVSHEVAAKLRALKEGTTVAVDVHALPNTPERKTFNAIGYLEGSEPGSGTILLSAHLDHLGVGTPVNGDAIYNGANDDAAGTTAVLELAHALAPGPKLRRNVLFVCYGSEEAGELGSTYFGEHPPVPLSSLVANLEFEMIGTQDPKMPAGVLLLSGWDRSDLGPTLKEHGALLGPDPYPEQHFFERSDNYALALKGVVAHTAAAWGTPPTYHQPDDDLAHVYLVFMTREILSLVEPVRWLATSDFRPSWNPGGRPEPGKRP